MLWLKFILNFIPQINSRHNRKMYLHFLFYLNLCWKCLFFIAEIQKVLLKLSKEKGCEIIGRWQKVCVRHFYWSITSTEEKEGSENLKLAKFQAFLYHVINKHKDLPSMIFNACAHGDIVNPRVRMHKGIILNN